MTEVPSYTLRFESGSLVLSGSETPPPLAERWTWDERVGAWRTWGYAYHDTYAALYRAQQAGEVLVRSEVANYGKLDLRFRAKRTARGYQSEAVEAWMEAGSRGQIILPTGTGKSFVAQLAMQQMGRDTLIVVPTLDLMNQWYSGLLTGFYLDEVGLLGGGYHELRPVTVTTYDSCYLHMPRYGDRFGLVVFDECHHLPGPSYLQAARSIIAPFRLGLTATPERQDGRHMENRDVIGPIVYRREIKELAGDFLAEYDVEEISVGLTPEERASYQEARRLYRNFVSTNRIRMGAPWGWARFLKLTSQNRAGRRAMKAYQLQRKIALSCSAKLTVVEELLEKHVGERVIVFTNDNDTVYELSRRLLVPAITHQTPVKERREILQRFREGLYTTIITSKVLNEGVDVPEAGVAIVLSGSSTVREHVQRLGRILRPSAGKRALLYELITSQTVEESVSRRRRQHDAYR